MTQDLSFAPNFIRFFKLHPPLFAKSDAKVMTVSGRRIQYDDIASIQKLFNSDALVKFDLITWWKLPDDERLEHLSNFIEGTYRQDLADKERSRRELQGKLRANGKALLNAPDVDYILSHLKSCRLIGDVRREAGFRFIDTKTNRMTPYDYNAIYFALRGGRIEKDIIDQFMCDICHITEDYNPRDPYRFRPVKDTNNTYQINSYVQPKWRTLDVVAQLPQEIDELMRHLFPKEKCREFVYTWIYHSLTSRAGTYLYLCGGQGSGKNTLSSVLASLHGLENTSMPKQDSLVGRFNHFLKNRSFVFFDEFNCRVRKDKDTLKTIINDRIQIEGKNRDHEDIDIHASYMVANNSLEAIGLDPVERRFSVPEVNHDSILTVHSRDWVEALRKKLTDDHYIAGFGNWVLENYKSPAWSSEAPYQTRRFEEIVLATARLGLSDMLTKITKKEQDEYDYYDERESFKRIYRGQTYPSLSDWQAFWKTVKKDGEPLGTVESRLFRVAERYRTKAALVSGLE